MSFNVGPRTISATGGSIKRVGNYRIHTFPSELVTDGLVLNLDAGGSKVLSWYWNVLDRLKWEWEYWNVNKWTDL